jgi:spermidine/putrescine ABC transporter ATP-binding subunit
LGKVYFDEGIQMTTANVPVIRFNAVKKSFGPFVAVENVSFTADSGETVALLGPSGCGKTTTLRLIAGFEEPDSGAIEIAGVSMAGKRPYERNVGLLFQSYALFPHMTVFENVAYGLKHRGWPKADIADRVNEMLRLVQLESFGARKPQQMSGGQQQRVALARVLATKPKLVLLDEPLSALDAKMREELRGELKQILAAVGSTTIVVTHDQDEAMSLADRIFVMNRGHIEQQGRPDEIYSHPTTNFVAEFIGSANWFEGEISKKKSSSFATVVTNNGTLLSVAASAAPSSAHVRVCVRPERVMIGPSDTQRNGAEANQLCGAVVDVINLGSQLHYRVDGPFGRMHVIEPNRGGSHFKMGENVKLRFRAEDCVVLAQA